MRLLFASSESNAALWAEAFARALPELEFIDRAKSPLPDTVDYALVWQPPVGLLAGLSGLKAVFSIGAGLDHLADPARCPRELPVVRMVDPSLTAGMSEYVLYQILRWHRSMHMFDQLQRAACWQVIRQTAPQQRRIGIMGAGELGLDAARKLRALGFQVSLWSRVLKSEPDMRSFAGQPQLAEFLSELDAVVCLLPLTSATRGVLNRKTLAQLPRGSYVINAARGEHVVLDDLLALIDAGHLSGAALDVFQHEPLAPNDPVWLHPKLTITPHVASQTIPFTAAPQIVANIQRFEQGADLLHQVDWQRGY